MLSDDVLLLSPLVASAPSAASWASVIAGKGLRASTASQPSAASHAPPGSGVDRTPGASRPRPDDPFPPLPRRHAPSRSPLSDTRAGDSPLQTTGAGGSTLRAGEHGSESSSSQLEAAASHPLPVSSSGQPTPPSSEQANPQVPVDIYGNPLTLTAWQLPEKASDIPTPSSVPSEERDEPKTPAGPSTIAMGFEQLKKLFMGASRQQPDTGPSTAAPTPAADDAASSGAFDSSNDATEYVEDS
ncbi:hypothetical protein, conserved [Eimeria praecox]|uniref:Uncharacterized protein n=1 Tax=Eimeria praecox TaxID=51316 RepID=U6H294_9EIME|nr:hypothetical protein, conserved [Eimeria praecox]